MRTNKLIIPGKLSTWGDGTNIFIQNWENGRVINHDVYKIDIPNNKLNIADALVAYLSLVICYDNEKHMDLKRFKKESGLDDFTDEEAQECFDNEKKAAELWEYLDAKIDSILLCDKICKKYEI